MGRQDFIDPRTRKHVDRAVAAIMREKCCPFHFQAEHTQQATFVPATGEQIHAKRRPVFSPQSGADSKISTRRPAPL